MTNIDYLHEKVSMFAVKTHNELLTKQYLIACFLFTHSKHHTFMNNPFTQKILAYNYNCKINYFMSYMQKEASGNNSLTATTATNESVGSLSPQNSSSQRRPCLNISSGGQLQRRYSIIKLNQFFFFSVESLTLTKMDRSHLS